MSPSGLFAHQDLCSDYFKKTETRWARSAMRRHLVDERVVRKYRNTTAVKWYEKYVLFRCTVSEMSSICITAEEYWWPNSIEPSAVAIVWEGKNIYKTCVQWPPVNIIKTPFFILCMCNVYVHGRNDYINSRCAHHGWNNPSLQTLQSVCTSRIRSFLSILERG